MTTSKLLIVDAALAHLHILPEQLQIYEITVIAGAYPQVLTDFPSHTQWALLDGYADMEQPLMLIDALQSYQPDCKLLIVMPNIPQQAIRYLQSGVTGLLCHTQTAEQLVGILKHIQAGHFYLDQEIAQLLAMRQIKKLLSPFVSLSSREFDVFCMLAEGRRLQTIAEELGISSKTVSNSQSQIKLKLGLATRTDIIEFAKNHGLIG
jgi:two-component system invasion response regulator UvrY